jgi:UDP-hydrolysing UDP-N-acetyl-D-glucosamine 2-epimerase
VVEALRALPDLTVDLIATAYALIHRFGSVADDCEPDTTLWTAVDGNTLETSALTTALVTQSCASYFRVTRPDVVLVCADRHETLGVCIAASYQNIPLLHLQGGETSGNIDHKVRWANSMLSDAHAVATLAAGEALIRAGCTWVEHTGCPSIDVALAAQADPPVTTDELDAHGTGAAVDPEQPFTLLLHHPETAHPESASDQMQAALVTAGEIGLPVIAFWPGADAGVSESAKVLRVMSGLRLIRHLRPRRFLKLLGQSSHAVGNSSALIREGSALGIRRTILGERQQGRPYTQEASDLYGDGQATPRIVDMVRRMVGQ